jgi:hypothetical protein
MSPPHVKIVPLPDVHQLLMFAGTLTYSEIKTFSLIIFSNMLLLSLLLLLLLLLLLFILLLHVRMYSILSRHVMEKPLQMYIQYFNFFTSY